jgi:hypothetical protein
MSAARNVVVIDRAAPSGDTRSAPQAEPNALEAEHMTSMSMRTDPVPALRGAALPAPDRSALTAQELHRLTLYKWRYGFEALGFDAAQVPQLMFLKWLFISRRIPS